MMTRPEHAVERRARAAFSLMEVLVCLAIFALVTAGIVYGYAQTNRSAEWSSMSLSAQSLALQSLEQARSAYWYSQSTTTNTGAGSSDELPASANTYTYTNALQIPGSGQTIIVTNYLTVTALSTNPPLRQIISKCVWPFPPSTAANVKWFTNAVVTQRAPDR
jgi:prepilin-type N-terminal cleavage/methylation domain-containing protein